MKIKPKCQSCSRIYLGGRGGYCEYCLSAKVRKKKLKPLRCLCGKLAIVVFLATVLSPEEEPLELEIPLCRGCCDLERTMERESGLSEAIFITNPAQIVVVKSLPRIKPALKGMNI
jgi:hypothetical protein